MSSTSRAPSRSLPTNPRPRAKSAAASAPIRAHPERPALPSNPRSRPSPPQERARVQESIARDPPSRRVRNDETPNAPHARGSDNSSVSSNSSSGSSFWSRGNTNSSAASSKTTLQSEDDLERRKTGKSTSIHPKGAQDTSAIESESSVDPKELAGLAWGRVTEVANVLTQEVSKVWANGLTPLGNRAEGDEQEEESHLTQVMRAYHLSNARSPSDLPDWLFSERERGQLGGLLRSEPHSDDSRERPAAPQQRNHSDNNHSSSTRSSETRLKNIQNFPQSIPKTLPAAKSTGADRLKMIRDRRVIPSHDRI